MMHFSMNSVQILVALSAAACLAAPESSSRVEDLKCMDTPRHKATPSTEKQLYKTCSAYEGLSCCNNETAIRIHGDDLYKFQNVVCKNKELSPQCKKYFLKDACFYECSPDLGPYISEEEGKDIILKNVPLCKSNCNNWFAACQNEFTCTKDWKKAMGSASSCSSTDKCQTIKDKFQNAEDFCEKVWGSSYEVVEDEEKCLRFDEPEKRDPSVYQHIADELSNSTDDDCQKGSSSSIKYHLVIVGVPFVLMIFSMTSNYDL